MATGQLPFRGASSGVIFHAILERAPVPAVRLNPDLPVKLEDLINHALEKDRELRYQSAKELRAELLRLKRDIDTSRSSAVPGLSSPDVAPFDAATSTQTPATPVHSTSAAAIGPKRYSRLPRALVAMLVAGFIAGPSSIEAVRHSRIPFPLRSSLDSPTSKAPKPIPLFLRMGNSSPLSPTAAVRLTSGSFKATAAASRISAKVGSEMCADLFVP